MEIEMWEVMVMVVAVVGNRKRKKGIEMDYLSPYL